MKNKIVVALIVLIVVTTLVSCKKWKAAKKDDSGYTEEQVFDGSKATDKVNILAGVNSWKLVEQDLTVSSTYTPVAFSPKVTNEFATIPSCKLSNTIKFIVNQSPSVMPYFGDVNNLVTAKIMVMYRNFVNPCNTAEANAKIDSLGNFAYGCYYNNPDEINGSFVSDRIFGPNYTYYSKFNYKVLQLNSSYFEVSTHIGNTLNLTDTVRRWKFQAQP